MKKKSPIKGLLFIICVIGFAGIAGCFSPWVASKVHKKIKVGMTAREVIDTLTNIKYKGYYSYKVILLDEEQEKECEGTRPEYEQCTQDKGFYACNKEYPSYWKFCNPKRYSQNKFLSIVDNIANKSIDYSEYKANIGVLYMGPVFQHNSFDIHFNAKGGVESITDVEHWD